jgi:hypothetical protein
MSEPPRYAHPRWFYFLVAACLVILTLIAIDRLAAY